MPPPKQRIRQPQPRIPPPKHRIRVSLTPCPGWAAAGRPWAAAGRPWAAAGWPLIILRPWPPTCPGWAAASRPWAAAGCPSSSSALGRLSYKAVLALVAPVSSYQPVVVPLFRAVEPLVAQNAIDGNIVQHGHRQRWVWLRLHRLIPNSYTTTIRSLIAKNK